MAPGPQETCRISSNCGLIASFVPFVASVPSLPNVFK
jgi:hypothetical protein